jgi:GNAT superfamily N-acetyltransferase
LRTVPHRPRQRRDPILTSPNQATATPRSAAQRLRRHLHEHGLRLTVLKLISDALRRASGGRARLNVYAFTAQPLRGAAATTAASGSTVIETIGPDDSRLALTPRPIGVLQARFAAGAECRMAFVKGRFAGMHWVTRGRHVEDEVRCTYVIDRPDAGVWDFDVYVEPAFRGSRVFLRLWQAAEHSLAAQGVQWSFSRIDVLNAASLASHARLGAKLVGHAAFVTLGPWQFSWASVAPRWHLARGGAPGPGFRLKPPRSTS